MPIYEYRCENGHTFEAMQRMSDDPLTECSVCGAPVQRVLSEGAPLPAQAVRYDVSLLSTTEKQFHVSADFPAAGKDTLFVSLPAWSPGSYEIQNYARYVHGFGAKNPGGQPLRWDRSDKDTWRVVTGKADRVTVDFDFVADTIDLSIARVASDFGQFLGTNLFAFEEGQLARPAEVRFHVPAGWQVTTALKGPVSGVYRAADYHELADAMTFLGRYSLDSLQADGKWIRLAVWPASDYTPAVVSRLKLHPALGVALAEQVGRVDGPPTADQVVDDWASVLCQRAFLEDVLAREAPGAFSPEQIARATAWNLERHEELLAWRGREAGAEAALDEEDEALLLRAWQLRVGPLSGAGGRPLRYRHVAVDEVQDFSPLEIQVLLGCLDERRSITLAGDTQQHIVEEGGFTSWTEFLAELGLEGTEMNTLRVSYRCSRQVAEFATGLLGDLGEEPTAPPTVRSGPPVELFRFTDHGACVAFLADALGELVAHEPLASVAILTPSRELSALYYRGLGAGEVPRLRQVEAQNFTFAPGVEVTEIEQAKGLEFDYVVLVEVSTTHFPDAPAARRRLHVGATRAVHQLWLTSVGTPAAAGRALLETR